MPIGLSTSMTDINNTIGNKARDFFNLYMTARALSQRLKLYADTDLAAIGFSAADITAIHNFEAFADTLCGIFDGTGPLPAQPTNFLADVSSIIGVGM